MSRNKAGQITLICKNPDCPESMWNEVVSVAVNDGLIDSKHLDLILESRKLSCPHCKNANRVLIELAPMVLW